MEVSDSLKIRASLQQLKQNRRSGFTLVELLVVLLILTVLASFMIPSLMGYIDKARDNQVIMETRQAVMAAQTLFDEAYAVSLPAPIAKKQDNVLDVQIGSDAANTIKSKIYDLAELDTRGTIEDVATDATGKIKTLTWAPFSSNGEQIECKYDAGSKDNLYSITRTSTEP